MTRQRGDLEMEYGGLGGRQHRNWTRHPLVLGLLAVALFAFGFAAFLLVASQLGDDTDAGSDPTAGETGESAAESDNAESDDSQAADGADAADDGADGSNQSEEAGSDDNASASPSLDAPPDGAFVEAKLNLDAGPGPGMFTLTGRVPDQATADAVLEAAQLSYAPFVESNLEVDESLEAAPWLATSPQLISLLPSVTDGTMMIVDGGVKLSARSPNPAYLANLEGAIEALSGGLPLEMVDLEITDLRPPLFEAAIDNGKITLTGYVPSPAIQELLVGGAAAAYGPENVADELTVEADTYPSFWMYTMPGVFQLFSPFPMYSIKVQDGITSGTLQGGVNFGVDSTEISEQAAQVLNIGVAVLSRDLTLHMTVEGHTDSSGPDDYNQGLSLARAKSVVAYFAAAGITEDRLLAIGAGESEPLASNDTDDGRAQNRRVEFLFGPPPSG